MSPFHMELLIFLRCNKELWDASTVEACMQEPELDHELDENDVAVEFFKAKII